MRTVRTRYAKGFRKSLSITVHCPFFGLGIASHRPLHHLHLISLPADDDIASDALIFHTSEALIGKGTAQMDCRQLLRDVRTDDLQRSGHRHEFSRLRFRRLTEVELHELGLQARRLEGTVVLGEAADVVLGEPVVEALLIERIGLREPS